MKIAGVNIQKGETKLINANIAKLPTRTEIDIPIYVSRATKDGPVLMISGGLHGDEINGVETVRRIIVNNYHIPTAGTVICIPIINIYGFINFSRQVPDGKDVNRSFPGSATGSLAGRVAHFLMNEVIEWIDFGIDFHTGGARINNYPQVRVNMADEKSAELAKAFAPPFIINSPYRDKSLRKEAAKKAKAILVFEAGESARLRKSAIDEGVEGAQRVMKHLKMRDSAATQNKQTVVISKSTWIRARSAGIHHSRVRNGEFVKKNELIGFITDPFGEFETEIKSHVDGYIIAINNNPVVNRGDALIHVGIADN
ncbi:MAG: succinylglutamate desuccinylase/aspartoacylase family protein [Cyclobacteriaceae bacterium]